MEQFQGTGTSRVHGGVVKIRVKILARRDSDRLNMGPLVPLKSLNQLLLTTRSRAGHVVLDGHVPGGAGRLCPGPAAPFWRRDYHPTVNHQLFMLMTIPSTMNGSHSQ